MRKERASCEVIAFRPELFSVQALYLGAIPFPPLFLGSLGLGVVSPFMSYFLFLFIFSSPPPFVSSRTFLSICGVALGVLLFSWRILIQRQLLLSFVLLFGSISAARFPPLPHLIGFPLHLMFCPVVFFPISRVYACGIRTILIAAICTNTLTNGIFS